MKKISLKDIKTGLKRDEMRMIYGGSGGSGGTSGGCGSPFAVGSANCQDSCFSDSDCDCMPCYSYGDSPMKKCKAIVCNSLYNDTRNACTC